MRNKLNRFIKAMVEGKWSSIDSEGNDCGHYQGYSLHYATEGDIIKISSLPHVCRECEDGYFEAEILSELTFEVGRDIQLGIRDSYGEIGGPPDFKYTQEDCLTGIYMVRVFNNGEYQLSPKGLFDMDTFKEAIIERTKAMTDYDSLLEVASDLEMSVFTTTETVGILQLLDDMEVYARENGTVNRTTYDLSSIRWWKERVRELKQELPENLLKRLPADTSRWDWIDREVYHYLTRGGEEDSDLQDQGPELTN